MNDTIMISKIAVITTVVITVATLLFVGRAYLDSQKCLKWYRRRFDGKPMSAKPPRTTWCQRIMDIFFTVSFFKLLQ